MAINLTKTSFLIISAIILFGIGTAYAAITITQDGEIVIIGDLDIAGQISGNTISELGSRLSILEGNP